LKVLVSVTDFTEAVIAAETEGVDILDIKNPVEGSLGCSFPHVVSDIVKKLGKHFPISAAAGDMGNTPGMASMACKGLAHCGVDFIKIGLFGSRSIEDASFLLRAAKNAVMMVNPAAEIIAVGYADYLSLKTLSPSGILEAAKLADIDGVMLDTYIKDGKSLFNHLEAVRLREFIEKAKAEGLLTALAGSLREDHLDILAEINPDIIGVRSAVCEDLNRTGTIDAQRLVDFVVRVKNSALFQAAR
jgi:hypothetical protein